MALVIAALAAASPAAATQGSVPLEVADFVAADDGVQASLADFFGDIDFDDTTTTPTIDRVFTFAPDWLAGDASADPMALGNEWAVPVLIGEKPIGLATVWINPVTVRPELADFAIDERLAAAFADLPDEAYVVHDEVQDAWLLLEGTTLTTLPTGATTSLASYRLALPDDAADAEAPSFAATLSGGTLIAVALVVILAVLLPVALRRRRSVDSE